MIQATSGTLIVFWLIGLISNFTIFTIGGDIQILLIIAVIVLLMQQIRESRI